VMRCLGVRDDVDVAHSGLDFGMAGPPVERRTESIPQAVRSVLARSARLPRPDAG
jgi:hypothetical protein